MQQQDISLLSKRLTILIGLSVVGAMAFGLSISFYRNLLFEETLGALTSRNRQLRLQIDQGLDTLAYYKSLQYRDKYAKENLGRLNPGEKIVILTQERNIHPVLEMNSSELAQRKETLFRQFLSGIPTIEHWRMTLFDPDSLTKLRHQF